VVTVSLRTHDHGNALDLLEEEDLELRRLFTSLRLKRGPSVLDRAEYGDLAKKTIRHLATREAALVDVAKVADTDPALREISERFEASMHERRPHIGRVEKMSRGVQGINLRIGQDFDNDMLELMQIVGTEIEWELGRALPEIKGKLQATERVDELKTADHLRSHAPTNLNPDGPRWRERAPVVSWLITVYDRLRDFPRASRSSR
jgi:hypothetical protein